MAFELYNSGSLFVQQWLLNCVKAAEPEFPRRKVTHGWLPAGYITYQCHRQALGRCSSRSQPARWEECPGEEWQECHGPGLFQESPYNTYYTMCSEVRKGSKKISTFSSQIIFKMPFVKTYAKSNLLGFYVNKESTAIAVVKIKKIISFSAVLLYLPWLDV